MPSSPSALPWKRRAGAYLPADFPPGIAGSKPVAQRRYQYSQQRRNANTREGVQTEEQHIESGEKAHKSLWQSPLGCFFKLVLAGLLLAACFQAVLWGTDRYHDLMYGVPRHSRLVAVTGLHDSSEQPSLLTATNVNHRIYVSIYSGDGTTYTWVSERLYGDRLDKVPVTLQVVAGTRSFKNIEVSFGSSKMLLENTGKSWKVKGTALSSSEP